jgi:predicted glutamine amidotransferase
VEGTNICIIIVKPADGTIRRKELKEAFRINSDGAGFMFNATSDDGSAEVRVYKGWFGFRQYYKNFKTCLEAYPKSTFVLHMRIATSGKKDKDNCHPFLISKDVGFAHNGVMAGLGDTNRSDTREFAEDTLAKLQPGWWDNAEILECVSQCAIASTSKYVLLVSDGSYEIINEHMGHWKLGCWYSNYSYTLPVVTAYSVKGPAINKRTWPVCGNRRDPDEEDYSCRSYSSFDHNSAVTGKATDTDTCIYCHQRMSVTNDDVGLINQWIRLCKACMFLLNDAKEITCPTCNSKTTITHAVLHADGYPCPFCHSDIPQDEIAWQIMSLRAGDDECIHHP